MSKAAELAALIGSQTALSNRNLIINGAMQVAQRGDATGLTSGGYHASDRFQTSLNSIGTWDIENVSDAPAGFSNSQKLTCTSPTGTLGAGDYAFCRHRIEAQNLQMLDYGASGAKSFTISFYVKSNKTGNATLEINQQDTDPVRAVALQYTINAANTWEYKEITVAGDASGVINNDNGIGFEIFWWLRSGSTYTGGSHQTAWYERVNADRNASNLDVGATANDTWQITGVQLELGEQATPFENRSFADELARCQRYFMQWNANNATREYVATCNYYDDDDGHGLFHTPVSMRAYPSIAYNDLAVFKRGVIDTSSVILNTTTPPTGDSNTVPFNMDNAGGLNAGEPFFVGFNSSTTGYIQLDAEL